MEGANLERTHLDGANLSKTKLKSAVLKYASALNANFFRSDLRNADLTLFDAIGSSLRRLPRRCYSVSIYTELTEARPAKGALNLFGVDIDIPGGCSNWRELAAVRCGDADMRFERVASIIDVTYGLAFLRRALH